MQAGAYVEHEGLMDIISLSLQALASVVTLWAIWQTGNKSLLGPSLSLVSDACFVVLNIYAGLWALVPFCAVIVVLHIRNLLKWRADAHREAVEAAVLNTAAVQGDNAKRRSAKAYEILAGGVLR